MEQFQNPLAKSILPNAQIHNLSLSWLGTGTSVKSGGVKLLCVFVIEKKNCYIILFKNHMYMDNYETFN